MRIAKLEKTLAVTGLQVGSDFHSKPAFSLASISIEDTGVVHGLHASARVGISCTSKPLKLEKIHPRLMLIAGGLGADQRWGAAAARRYAAIVRNPLANSGRKAVVGAERAA